MVAQADPFKTNSRYEAQTQSIAEDLIKSTRGKQNIFNRLREQMRWDDKVLEWTMANPGLRVQMFRFIDAIPALQSKAEIANHFQQYMSEEAVELPSALKAMINFS
ncbi:MAG: L-glutamate gamma-semialdehyde dehydrogenase, partial [Waterburya sp.]